MSYMLFYPLHFFKKRRIHHLIRDAVGKIDLAKLKEHGIVPFPSTFLQECIQLAEGPHADWLLTAIAESLQPSSPMTAYGALKLLEYLVTWCNGSFHHAMSEHTQFREKLLGLAMARVVEHVESKPTKKNNQSASGKDVCHSQSHVSRDTQHLARLTILEYSRIFAGEEKLEPLAQLAASFEFRTKRSLLRAIHVQERHVGFREIKPEDVISIPSHSSEEMSRRDVESRLPSYSLHQDTSSLQGSALGRGFSSSSFAGVGSSSTSGGGGGGGGTEDWIARPGMPYKNLQDFFSRTNHWANENTPSGSHQDPLHTSTLSGHSPPSRCSSFTTPGGSSLENASGHEEGPYSAFLKSMTRPQRWKCVACQQDNSPMTMTCSACETPRFTDDDEDEEDEDSEQMTEGRNVQEEKKGVEEQKEPKETEEKKRNDEGNGSVSCEKA